MKCTTGMALGELCPVAVTPTTKWEQLEEEEDGGIEEGHVRKAE